MSPTSSTWSRPGLSRGLSSTRWGTSWASGEFLACLVLDVSYLFLSYISYLAFVLCCLSRLFFRLLRVAGLLAVFARVAGGRVPVPFLAGVPFEAAAERRGLFLPDTLNPGRPRLLTILSGFSRVLCLCGVPSYSSRLSAPTSTRSPHPPLLPRCCLAAAGLSGNLRAAPSAATRARASGAARRASRSTTSSRTRTGAPPSWRPTAAWVRHFPQSCGGFVLGSFVATTQGVVQHPRRGPIVGISGWFGKEGIVPEAAAAAAAAAADHSPRRVAARERSFLVLAKTNHEACGARHRI